MLRHEFPHPLVNLLVRLAGLVPLVGLEVKLQLLQLPTDVGQLPLQGLQLGSPQALGI